MTKIVSKRVREQTQKVDEVDFEIEIMSDEELTDVLRKISDQHEQEEFDYYHEDWVIQGRQALGPFAGLRMVEEIHAMQRDWDCSYDPVKDCYWVRTPDPAGLVCLTDQCVQSISTSIKHHIIDTMLA